MSYCKESVLEFSCLTVRKGFPLPQDFPNPYSVLQTLIGTVEAAAGCLTEPGQLEDLVHRMELTAPSLSPAGESHKLPTFQILPFFLQNWIRILIFDAGQDP